MKISILSALCYFAAEGVVLSVCSRVQGRFSLAETVEVSLFPSFAVRCFEGNGQPDPRIAGCDEITLTIGNSIY